MSSTALDNLLSKTQEIYAMAVSNYESIRLKNIEDNKRVLRELGLLNPFNPIPRVIFQKKLGRPQKRKAECDRTPRKVPRLLETSASGGSVFKNQRRRSSRIQGMDAPTEPDIDALVQDELDEEDQKKPTPFKRPNSYGAIEGVEVGRCWETRVACCGDGIHRPTVAGIHGGPEGCYSLALSGGYEDDIDMGDCFTYTGEGGRDLKGTKANPKNLRTAPQSKDQVLARGNLALSISVETGNPVRVIRGYKLQSPFAPEEGYRYDGLYKVEKFWYTVGMSNYGVYKFALRRLKDQAPPPWDLMDTLSVASSQDSGMGSDQDSEHADDKACDDGSDVKSLTDSDVKSLTDSDVKSLTDSDVKSLTASDVKSLTDSDVKSLAGDTASDVKPLTSDTDSDVKPLTGEDGSDVKPLTGETTSDVKPLTGETTSDVKSLTGDTDSDVKPLTGEDGSDVKPLTGETTSDVKSLTGETTSDVKPLTGETTSDVKSLTGDTDSDVKPLTGEDGSDVKSLTGDTDSDVKPLTGEDGSDVKPLTGETTSDVKSLTGETTSDVKPLTGETTSDVKSLTGDTDSDVKPLIEEDGSDVKSNTGDTGFDVSSSAVSGLKQEQS